MDFSKQTFSGFRPFTAETLAAPAASASSPRFVKRQISSIDLQSCHSSSTISDTKPNSSKCEAMRSSGREKLGKGGEPQEQTTVHSTWTLQFNGSPCCCSVPQSAKKPWQTNFTLFDYTLQRFTTGPNLKPFHCSMIWTVAFPVLLVKKRNRKTCESLASVAVSVPSKGGTYTIVRDELIKEKHM